MLSKLSDRIIFNNIKVSEYIVRHTVTDIPFDKPMGPTTVDEFIEKIDENFAYLAHAIGATVVDHTWGLIRRLPARRYYYPDLEGSFGIEDYLLGARVQVLGGRALNRDLDSIYTSVQNRLDNASKDFLTTNGWTTDAAYGRQFTVQYQNSAPQLVLHDIEPRVKGIYWRP